MFIVSCLCPHPTYFQSSCLMIYLKNNWFKRILPNKGEYREVHSITKANKPCDYKDHYEFQPWNYWIFTESGFHLNNLKYFRWLCSVDSLILKPLMLLSDVIIYQCLKPNQERKANKEHVASYCLLDDWIAMTDSQRETERDNFT